MALWVLEPVADGDDPMWQGRKQYARVVVRAANPTWARLVARRLDSADLPAGHGQGDPQDESGFENEKLYRVSPYAEEGRYASDGPDEILEKVPRR